MTTAIAALSTTLAQCSISSSPLNPHLESPYPKLLENRLPCLPTRLTAIIGDYLDLDITIAELFLRSTAIEFMENEETSVVDGIEVWGKRETRAMATIWGPQISTLNLGRCSLMWRTASTKNFAASLIQRTLALYYTNVSRIIAPYNATVFVKNTGSMTNLFASTGRLCIEKSPYGTHEPLLHPGKGLSPSDPLISFMFLQESLDLRGINADFREINVALTTDESTDGIPQKAYIIPLKPPLQE